MSEPNRGIRPGSGHGTEELQSRAWRARFDVAGANPRREVAEISGIARFAPLPEERRWQAWSPDQGTPEEWLEPLPGPAGAPRGPRHLTTGRLLGAAVAIAVGAGVLSSAGTLLTLRAAGMLNAAVTDPTSARAVAVKSESSAIIDAVQQVSPAVVIVQAVDGTAVSPGSGIVFDADGWILTSKHLVAGSSRVSVVLADRRTYEGRIYGTDTLTDLAIVKIDAPGLATAPIGESRTLQVGQLAIAIGSPLGLGYPNTVTTGIVSALGRSTDAAADPAGSSDAVAPSLHGLVQTDALFDPGDSGGPLVNASGQVVGIYTAAAKTAPGIGLAIPIDLAKPIMQQALAGEPIARPWLGVSCLALDDALKARYGLALGEGAWIHSVDATAAVVRGGPGERAGLATGDIITGVEGTPIDAAHTLDDALVPFAPGRQVALRVFRAGRYLTLEATLGTRPA